MNTFTFKLPRVCVRLAERTDHHTHICTACHVIGLRFHGDGQAVQHSPVSHDIDG